MAAAPLRLGLIGAGRWGRVYIRTLRAMPAVTLRLVASRNPQTASLVDPGCRVLSDWRELLSADLDAVILATPPQCHVEMAAAAVEAGLPVLIEKPLSMDVASARALLADCERRGALAVVGHTQLRHPGYEALKAALPALGPIRLIRSTGGGWGPFRAQMPPLWDYGAHDAAFCLDLLGAAPQAVSAKRTRAQASAEGPGENFELTLGFSGGSRAEISLGNLMERKTRRLEVVCQGGTLVLNDAPVASLTLLVPAEAPRALPFSSVPPLTCVVDGFAAQVRARSRDLGSLRLGVSVVETLARCAGALEAA